MRHTLIALCSALLLAALLISAQTTSNSSSSSSSTGTANTSSSSSTGSSGSTATGIEAYLPDSNGECGNTATGGTYWKKSCHCVPVGAKNAPDSWTNLPTSGWYDDYLLPMQQRWYNVSTTVSYNVTHVNDTTGLPYNETRTNSTTLPKAMSAYVARDANGSALLLNGDLVLQPFPVCNTPLPNSQRDDGSGLWGPLNKGDQAMVPICLVVGNSESTNKVFFFPTVDEFSLLQVQSSFHERWLDFDLRTLIQIEMGGKASMPTPRFAQKKMLDGAIGGMGGQCALVPFVTAIITLDNGNVQSIDWDGPCNLCESGYCAEFVTDKTGGFCATPIEKCDISGNLTGLTVTGESNGVDCDLKVYVGWTGTDARGEYLTSASKKLSNFRKYSLSQAYNDAASFAGESFPAPPVGYDPTASVG